VLHGHATESRLQLNLSEVICLREHQRLMDNNQLLPIWAQPHSFFLHGGRVSVFTFGLAMPAIRSLGSAAGAAEFGERFGYEWLATLADAFTAGDEKSQLNQYLEQQYGILGPVRVKDRFLTEAPRTRMVPDDVLQVFATEEGARIGEWAVNAFGGLDRNLYDSAKRRARVPTGYEHQAEYFFETVEQRQGQPFRRRLVSVHRVDGGAAWGDGYQTILERLALEFQDLAIRRPQLRLCRRCGRLYVPFRRTDPPYCWGRLWSGGRFVRDCLAGREAPPERLADDRERWRRQYKKRKARVYRRRDHYGAQHALTIKAERELEDWKDENPPPERRRRGRPPLRAPDDQPPVTPSAE
jgi:hypothetical protein